jgi:hypothetical protein
VHVETIWEGFAVWACGRMPTLLRNWNVRVKFKEVGRSQRHCSTIFQTVSKYIDKNTLFICLFLPVPCSLIISRLTVYIMAINSGHTAVVQILFRLFFRSSIAKTVNVATSVVQGVPLLPGQGVPLLPGQGVPLLHKEQILP